MPRVGIVGYGNLGRMLEKIFVEDSRFELVGVFSRREISSSYYIPFNKIYDYADKIDVLALAMSSRGDITENAPALAGKFNTVDSFDNHALIAKYRDSMSLAKGGDRISVISAGWDPGLLSMQRATALIFKNAQISTFWGKGVSQGHTNAVKRLEGVVDAVQFTLPNKIALCRAKKSLPIKSSTESHRRLVYLCCERKDRPRLKKEIRQMPDYFLGYRTVIKFVSEKTVKRFAGKMSHQGKVISSNDCCTTDFTIKAASNPYLTASVVASYVLAVPKMLNDGLSGVYDCLDIPLKYLTEGKDSL